MKKTDDVAILSAPTDACDAIRNAERIALIGHVTPDADCIGVIGAMHLALKKMGKRPVASMPDGSVARKLQFLVDLAGWNAGTKDELAACDLALVMDTAKEKRVNVDGKLEALPGAAVLNVDHHESNTRFGKWNWIEGQRSSACEMIYELIGALGCDVTPDIATLVYAGIHSDTQGFSLSNTTGRSLEVAHQLADAGADIIDTCERLCRGQSRNEFELLKVIYANTQVSDDGKLAWSSADFDEIRTAGCKPNDIDAQVEVVRSIEGVRVAILFTEANRGKIRMNFRGERGWPVLELAQQFHGGGHEQAAGAILDGNIPNAVEQVIRAARAHVARLSS